MLANIFRWTGSEWVPDGVSDDIAIRWEGAEYPLDVGALDYCAQAYLRGLGTTDIPYPPEHYGLAFYPGARVFVMRVADVSFEGMWDGFDFSSGDVVILIGTHRVTEGRVADCFPQQDRSRLCAMI